VERGARGSKGAIALTVGGEIFPTFRNTRIGVVTAVASKLYQQGKKRYSEMARSKPRRVIELILIEQTPETTCTLRSPTSVTR